MSYDFVRVARVQNMFTSEWFDVHTEIHEDDVDWLCRSWQRVFEIEWKVRQAGPQINPFDPWSGAPR